MSRLIINKLVYSIITIDGERYGATIQFKEGLNIIFGPNSVGKTSIITGIVYGLGAEKGLGIFKSIQNPFKPEFYKSIDGHQVKQSYLHLEISNGNEKATIFRYIQGGDIDIVATKKCSYEEFITAKEFEKYIVVGDGVFSENGFQNFLFNFIGLYQVDLPTYDQKLSKLYFENILPLFFVEQRAGWSQIQARQVTRYNIKDLKKVAFEYLFGLDRFKLHLTEIKVKEFESKLKKLKDELNQKEENLLITSNAEKVDEIPLVNTNTIGKTSISDYIRYLKDKYQAESELINQVTSQNKEYEESNIKLRDLLKTFDFQYRMESEKIEKINIEITGYQNYLERIQKNKYKNKQLQKIKEFTTELNIKSCPVCEAKLQVNNEGECMLCHSDLSKKNSTPEQNLAFLEDEENTFKKVIYQRVLDRRKIIEKRNQIKDKIKEYESQLDHQTKTYAGKEFAALRQRILETDSTHKEMEKYSRIATRWEELKPLRRDIILTEIDYQKLKDEISQYEQSVNDNLTIDTIKTFVQSNVKTLGLFKGNLSLIDTIRVDGTDNYTPYLDNFDIYNISSSSDNIRIILSYYLALLQASLKLKYMERIKFPNILILDEPKQQNLDNDSLLDCLTLIESIPSSASQVIMTTYSELQSDREKFKSSIVYEMKNNADYLLKKMSK
ncbi:MAG: AAA family ATPase [Chitinophagaceae bacterium]|nr:AAA family ATPase [Chitinophagaceae bacterium]